MFLRFQEKRMNFHITMGNNAKCTPVGRGTIVFQTEAGEQLQATNVLHVPGLGMNLLSVSQLQNKGYDVSSSRINYMSNTQVGKRRLKLELEVTGCTSYS